MATLPREAKALLDTIAGPESRGAYDVIYGGSKFTDFSDHPRQYVPITSGPNQGKYSSAAGKYQFLGSTWDAYAPKAGVSDFSPASQDAVAWELAQDEYRRDTGRDLLTDLRAGDLSRVPQSLRNQWTSLPGGIEQGIGRNAFNVAYQGNLTPLNPIQQQRAEQLAMRQRLMAPAKPGGNMFAGLFDNIAGGIKGGINAGLGFFGNPTIMAPTPAPGAAPGGGLQDTIKDAMLGTVAGRTAIVKALMAQNIGQAPIMASGRVPGGTAAYAVNRNGAAPVTLMRPLTGTGGESSRAFDALNHAGQNMEIYRANRAAIGGPITQGSINTALARGTTLVRSASDHPYSGESSISGFYDGVAQSLV